MPIQVKNTYVGRFAPSPTGPLHFGSLVAALASYLDAKHHNGAWLLRIEDLDPPRESTSAPKIILDQLAQFGFEWDSEVVFQSRNLANYKLFLDQLSQQGDTYHCNCSRKSYKSVYPGRCRNLLIAEPPYATRIRVSGSEVAFDDLFQAEQRFDLEPDIGDFILKRKDGLFAYQLAVVIDDYQQGVTHIVRGSDLLDSTPRQIYLGGRLGLPIPTFGHIPVVVDQQGNKLSKQNHAEPITSTNATETLKQALSHLGQTLPRGNIPAQILSEASQNWSRSRVPRVNHSHLPNG